MICGVQRHQKSACKIILQQSLIAITATAVSYFAYDAIAARGVLFGFAVAIANTVMIVWRMWQSEQALHQDAHKYLSMFYRSSLERLVLVAILLAAGMGLIGLHPLAVTAGFALGQLTLIVSQIMRGIKSN